MIGRSGCPGTKRVPRQSRFAFRCHRSRLMKQKREREKETIRKVPSSSNISKYIEKKECMNGNA